MPEVCSSEAWVSQVSQWLLVVDNWGCTASDAVVISWHPVCVGQNIVTSPAYNRLIRRQPQLRDRFFAATVSNYVVHGRWNRTRTIRLRFHNVNGRYRRAYKHFEVELSHDGIDVRNDYATCRTCVVFRRIPVHSSLQAVVYEFI